MRLAPSLFELGGRLGCQCLEARTDFKFTNIFGSIAGDLVAVAQRRQFRFGVAKFASQSAALGEGALTPKLGEIGRRAGDAFETALACSREGVEQRSGVGVRRRAEYLFGGSYLHDFSGVEDGDAMGDGSDGSDVVADEDDTGAFFLLKFSEESEDLGLEGDVEGSCRLVSDEDLGAACECHSDDHALLLAA